MKDVLLIWKFRMRNNISANSSLWSEIVGGWAETKQILIEKKKVTYIK